MPEKTNKVAIIGAGSVGATIAYACLIRGVAKRISIYDLNADKVQSELLDLNHGLQFVPMAIVDGSDDVAVCADADVIVVTAGAKQKPGQTRLDLTEANVRICRDLLPKLQAVAPRAIFLMVTNPVDVLTYVAMKITGLSPAQVIGSGTVLDSSRFRYLIGKHLDVAVQSVHAYIAGEHGDSEVPLWSSASIANIPLRDWARVNRGSMTRQEEADIFHNVRTAAAQVIAGKGATNYAIGLATAKILEALLHDEHRVLPVSSLISDVCFSLPSIVNSTGVEAVLPVPLHDAELTSLRKSAAVIRDAIKQAGF
ncbi:MAG TPA: L-lactate dehydrogenase [Tepidisphaeraceae bacterium]|jgi:L-lactate dehydrogenase|nr:L-lactate dehydrogenase [Tepidisphaeraceae bacterium]